MKHFDVIVVGGGHAGVEAALASARRGACTALITFRKTDLGTMSCNPAIGGIGKGHLVREIDALDGVMGLAADYAGIQFRLLNRSRGAAVQGPRTQADRQRYRWFIQDYVAKQAGLEVIEAEVTDFVMDGSSVCGVFLADGATVRASAVVLTTGTFLNGMIHIGQERVPAGRQGADASTRLAERLKAFDLHMGRLKTGTPARLNGKSINWSAIGRQDADSDPTLLSFLSDGPSARQIACGVTHTTTETHQIIRENLHLSAMRSGFISGVGPRYCPSVEDKVTRFSDKESHNVFLEPEGLDDDTVYPNGISTSLPRDVQERFLRTIPGLEAVEIIRHGYAIEYDYIDARSLRMDLSVRGVDGLFFAGQINGTTGYEEAAAQGLVAGLNAAASAVSLDKVIFTRDQSYIGVMLDDLTTRGVTEPYRMFTSRAEYRLSLRADNADQRLTPLALERGFVSENRKRAFCEKMERLQRLRTALVDQIVTAEDSCAMAAPLPKDGSKRNFLQILGLAEVDLGKASECVSRFADFEKDDLRQLQIEAFYAPYLERHIKEAASLSKDRAVTIPDDFDFESLASLSNELKEKLKKQRPQTLEHAGRIEGMTPTAMVLLMSSLKGARRSENASAS